MMEDWNSACLAVRQACVRKNCKASVNICKFIKLQEFWNVKSRRTGILWLNCADKIVYVLYQKGIVLMNAMAKEEAFLNLAEERDMAFKELDLSWWSL